LRVFPFEQNGVADACGELGGGVERGFDRDVIHFAREDALKIIGVHSFLAVRAAMPQLSHAQAKVFLLIGGVCSERIIA
jgi:hypothetical protein